MRKPPQQKRSRELVEKLLDATATTIAERGLDNTTTNHIAEQAGVSIGSLYQYFPDKQALVEGLLERMGRGVGENFRRRAEVVQINQLSLHAVASTAIAYGLHLMRSDPVLSELMRNWNRLPVDRLLDPIERLFLAMAQPYFLRNYRDYPVQDLEAKLYVLINSTLFTCIRFLFQENTMIREEVLVRTLADMIVAVLETPEKA
ncbi:MAG: TetR/AcrR family transcriptional regulator [Pedobacter sp.]|nr:TetR/AcrR family transcriptional regulator [Pedobacter sp.]